MTEETISIAERIARNLHGRAKQLGNQNSISRIEKLVKHFEAENPNAPEYATDAIWLKDAIADFKVSKGWLSFQGVDERTIEILSELHRAIDQNYKLHIDKVSKSENEWAVRVKLIEVSHELSPDYSKRANMQAINQIRYIPAKLKLNETIKNLYDKYVHLTEDMVAKHEVSHSHPQEAQDEIYEYNDSFMGFG